MTLGRETTAEQLDDAVDKLAKTVETLRSMSPLYADYERGEIGSIIDRDEDAVIGRAGAA